MLNSQKLLKDRLSGQVESKQNKKDFLIIIIIIINENRRYCCCQSKEIKF